jgi:hypothetical protein
MRSIPGWKGWVRVDNDYVSPSTKLVSMVQSTSARTRSGVDRSASRGVQGCRTTHRRTVSSPGNVTGSRRTTARAGWKGWVEVPDEYLSPSDKLVSSILACSSRTRSGLVS